MQNLYKANKNSFSILLKIKASAKVDAIENFMNIEENYMLKIQVKAQPENGKANKAIIRLLAKSWKIPASNFKIIIGLNSSKKVLEIKNISEDALKEIFTTYIT